MAIGACDHGHRDHRPPPPLKSGPRTRSEGRENLQLIAGRSLGIMRYGKNERFSDTAKAGDTAIRRKLAIRAPRLADPRHRPRGSPCGQSGSRLQTAIPASFHGRCQIPVMDIYINPLHIAPLPPPVPPPPLPHSRPSQLPSTLSLTYFSRGVSAAPIALREHGRASVGNSTKCGPPSDAASWGGTQARTLLRMP